jgi:hypothetical protein
MTVRNEMDDAAEYNESLVREEPEKKPKADEEKKEADPPRTIRSRGKKQ